MKSQINALRRAVVAFLVSVTPFSAKLGTGGRFFGHSK
jgi:hypothetical protein